MGFAHRLRIPACRQAGGRELRALGWGPHLVPFPPKDGSLPDRQAGAVFVADGPRFSPRPIAQVSHESYASSLASFLELS